MPQKHKWKRSLVCLLLVAAIFVVYEARLAQWQLVDGSKYSKISDESTSFYVKLDAARGEILDKDGNTLSGNKTCYNIVMNAMTMDSDRNPAILEAIKYLNADGISWTDKLPIRINEAGEYEFIENRDKDIEALKSADMLNMQEYATASECMTALISRYNCEGYSAEDARNIISVRYNMTRVQFSRSEPYTIATDVPMETIEKISEHSLEMKGIEVRVSAERDYSDGTIAPHILGSIGSISQEQYDSYSAAGNTYSSSNVSGYSYTDLVGQSGIESAFESTLRGINGKESVTTDSNGDVVSTQVTETPVAGNSVYLTIDKKLQQVANESLKKNVELAHKGAEDCNAGAVVVLDVETFGVLAAATYPTYDLGLYSTDDKYYYNLLEDETKPLFNRAFDGIFTPGSVFKPLVAMAALEEGVIDTSFTVDCPGYYDYYKDGNPITCYNSIAHGIMNVSSAIKQSCNVFFLDVGRQLTINKMNIYADAFSLGKKTGIEISEASGIMSNPTEYLANHGTSWVDGLTTQAAIGQADSMFSPLQLATYCATIANDGVRLKTHLYSKTTDYDGGHTISEYEPVVECNTEISEETLNVVQEAMKSVCEEGGTAYGTFGDYGIAIAAKTGTAENPAHSDNTTFIAYAPYDNPKIAVAVVLEYGKNGTYSRAVAKDIFDQYFYGKVSSDTKTDDGADSIDSADNGQSTGDTSGLSSSEENSADSGMSRDPETSRGDDIPNSGTEQAPADSIDSSG